MLQADFPEFMPAWKREEKKSRSKKKLAIEGELDEDKDNNVPSTTDLAHRTNGGIGKAWRAIGMEMGRNIVFNRLE
jgi:hypothetical protein